MLISSYSKHLCITTTGFLGDVLYIADLTKDFEGDPRGYDGTPEPRGDGSDFDIGADEYTGEPCPVADFSGEPTSGSRPLAVQFTDPS